MRKFLLAACAAVLGANLAVAGSGDDAKAKAMESMMAEMMKCSICKHYGARMQEIGPMSMDVVTLDNGMAIVHDVQSEAGVKAFHAAHDAASEAGAACAKMTDEQAKSELCHFCQQIRATMHKGASFGTGKTKSGDLMVLTSNDAAVQKEIAALKLECAAMAEQMAGH